MVLILQRTQSPRGAGNNVSDWSLLIISEHSPVWLPIGSGEPSIMQCSTVFNAFQMGFIVMFIYLCRFLFVGFVLEHKYVRFWWLNSKQFKQSFLHFKSYCLKSKYFRSILNCISYGILNCTAYIPHCILIILNPCQIYALAFYTVHSTLCILHCIVNRRDGTDLFSSRVTVWGHVLSGSFG